MPSIRVNKQVLFVLEGEKKRYKAASYNDLFGKMVCDKRIDEMTIGLSEKERKQIQRTMRGLQI